MQLRLAMLQGIKTKICTIRVWNVFYLLATDLYESIPKYTQTVYDL